MRVTKLMALFKVPCILIAMVGLHTAATSPQPPPSIDDKEIKNTMEGFMKQRSGPFIVKVRSLFLASLPKVNFVLDYMLGSGSSGKCSNCGKPRTPAQDIARDSLHASCPRKCREDPVFSGFPRGHFLDWARGIHPVPVLP